MSFSKLRAKYKSFESRRQLYAEYDIFLADERIIRMLPQTLGKVFYRSAAKRPIPVVLSSKKQQKAKESNEQDRAVAKLARKRKFSEVGGSESVAGAAFAADEITKALDSALVNLTNSPNCEIKVAKEAWPAEWIADNVQAVVEGLVNRFVPKKWQNVRGIYIKGERTAALPIWLAGELWTEKADVIAGTSEVDEAEKETPKTEKKLLQNAKGTVRPDEKRRVRKASGDQSMDEASKPPKRPRLDSEKSIEATERKARLNTLKAQAVLEAEHEI